MELTNDEFMDILDMEYFPSQRTGYTIPPGIYETGDIKTKRKNVFDPMF